MKYGLLPTKDFFLYINFVVKILIAKFSLIISGKS